MSLRSVVDSGITGPKRLPRKLRDRAPPPKGRATPFPGTKPGNAATGEIIHTPPEGEAVLRELLANWERFLNGERHLVPLIRLAAAHYQFEAIHPFTDGNGRTRRILNSLFLIQEGLLPTPILYLSRYIIGHKDEYHGLLLDITRHADWKPAWPSARPPPAT